MVWIRLRPASQFGQSNKAKQRPPSLPARCNGAAAGSACRCCLDKYQNLQLFEINPRK